MYQPPQQPKPNPQSNPVTGASMLPTFTMNRGLDIDPNSPNPLPENPVAGSVYGNYPAPTPTPTPTPTPGGGSWWNYLFGLGNR